MTYGETIKEGFGLIHRNWQLIVIQLAASVVGCVGFFVIVGIPLAITLIMLGIDLAELGNIKDMLGMLKEPSGLISRYRGLIVVLAASLIVYLLSVSIIWLYCLGGSAGLIRTSIKEPSVGFSMKGFLLEGKRLFLPLAGYMLGVGLMFAGALFLWGALGGLAVFVPHLLGLYGLLGVFMKVLFTLSVMFFGFIFILGLMALSIEGLVVLVFEGTGMRDSLKKGYDCLKERPETLGLYTLFIVGYFLIYFLLALIGFPFKYIPVIGTLLTLPFQLLSYLLQGYLCLAMLASSFAYYVSTFGRSIAEEGISPEGGPGQGPLPGPSERTA